MKHKKPNTHIGEVKKEEKQEVEGFCACKMGRKSMAVNFFTGADWLTFSPAEMVNFLATINKGLEINQNL